jgi:hypothetical protein
MRPHSEKGLGSRFIPRQGCKKQRPQKPERLCRPAHWHYGDCAFTSAHPHQCSATVKATSSHLSGSPAVLFSDHAAPCRQPFSRMLLHPLRKLRRAHQAKLHRDVCDVRGRDDLLVAIDRGGEAERAGRGRGRAAMTGAALLKRCFADGGRADDRAPIVLKIGTDNRAVAGPRRTGA